jgi:hypothetical protein
VTRPSALTRLRTLARTVEFRTTLPYSAERMQADRYVRLAARDTATQVRLAAREADNATLPDPYVTPADRLKALTTAAAWASDIVSGHDYPTPTTADTQIRFTTDLDRIHRRYMGKPLV